MEAPSPQRRGLSIPLAPCGSKKHVPLRSFSERNVVLFEGLTARAVVARLHQNKLRAPRGNFKFYRLWNTGGRRPSRISLRASGGDIYNRSDACRKGLQRSSGLPSRKRGQTLLPGGFQFGGG